MGGRDPAVTPEAQHRARLFGRRLGGGDRRSLLPKVRGAAQLLLRELAHAENLQLEYPKPESFPQNELLR